MFFTLLMMAFALAGNYSTTLDAKQTSAPTGYASDSVLHATSGVIEAENQGDLTVNSSWSYVKCIVSDEVAFAVFQSTPANWPSSWPSTATCTYGGHTLTITINSRAWENAHNHSWSLPAGVTFTMPTGARGAKKYDLPAGNHQEGIWPGRISATQEWDGIHCGVTNKGNLVLWVDRTLGDSSGYCSIPQTGGGSPFTFPVTFDRI